MPAPPLPPPAVPPPHQADNSWFKRLGSGTILIVILMLFVGSALLISKLTGFSSGNAVPTVPVAKIQTSRPELVAVHITVTPSLPPTVILVIKVYVSGEVRTPGVYQMQAGDRIEDALKLAGGVTQEADQTHLDLAQRVKDEMQIVVPARTLFSTSLGGVTTQFSGGVTQPANVSGQTGESKTAAGTSDPVNINTASQADLDRLPGIGTVLAQRIVDYRIKNGPFKTLDDLRKVQGLTKATLEKIKEKVTF